MRALAVPALLVLAAAPAACTFEVERSEIRIVADAKNDRLDVLIVSRGIYSTAKNDKQLEKDFESLLRCRDAGAIPMSFGVIDLAEVPDEEELVEPMALVLQHLEVEPGAFFVDGEKRLCFYQFLRIHRPRDFCAAFDACVRGIWANGKERAAKDASPETLALVERAVAEKWPLLRVEGAAFAFGRPLATADHEKEAKQLAEHLAKDPDEARMLADNHVAIVRRENVTEYVLGELGAERCDFVAQSKEKATDSLLELFADREPTPPAVTDELVEKQFTAFRGREARVPPAFAAAKKRGAAFVKR